MFEKRSCFGIKKFKLAHLLAYPALHALCCKVTKSRCFIRHQIKMSLGEALHISWHFSLSFPTPLCVPDSLVPVQHLSRQTPPPPPLPPPPPPPPRPQRRSRRSFYLKTPSCLCTPAAQWAVSRRASNSLLQDKVTHSCTHTSSIFINPLSSILKQLIVPYSSYISYVEKRTSLNAAVYLNF